MSPLVPTPRGMHALLLALLLPAALAIGLPAHAADPPAVVSHVKSPARFDDVRDDLQAAIEGQGLVIDSRSHIQRMLERTGKDLGATREVYRDAESFQFCSARLSRRMMEADPTNVAMCPFSVAVYVTADRPDAVVVAYRRPWRADATPAAAAALKDIEALLERIAREALGRK